MTTLAARVMAGEVEPVDVLVGGTPCQAFSVAGMRESLSDERGNLTLEFVRILDAIDDVRGGENPAIAVWENVPGVLNTKDNAFGCFLGALCGDAWVLQPPGGRWTNAGVVFGQRRNVAWRVLDAQYFGVAQRRERVFVVASADPRCHPAEILFEQPGSGGNTAPRREAGQSTARAVESRAGECGQERVSNQTYRMRGFGDYVEDSIGSTLKSRDYRDSTDLIVVNGRQPPLRSDAAHPLSCQDNGMDNVICINGNIIDRAPQHGGNGFGVDDSGAAYTLTATDRHGVQYGDVVRRLTPVEFERLQGMPDNHTRIPWRGKSAADCPDGHRYQAIGNSMAVPVMRWIGERIMLQSSLAASSLAVGL